MSAITLQKKLTANSHLESSLPFLHLKSTCRPLSKYFPEVIELKMTNCLIHVIFKCRCFQIIENLFKKDFLYKKILSCFPKIVLPEAKKFFKWSFVCSWIFCTLLKLKFAFIGFRKEILDTWSVSVKIYPFTIDFQYWTKKKNSLPV